MHSPFWHSLCLSNDCVATNGAVHFSCVVPFGATHFCLKVKTEKGAQQYGCTPYARCICANWGITQETLRETKTSSTLCSLHWERAYLFMFSSWILLYSLQELTTLHILRGKVKKKDGLLRGAEKWKQSSAKCVEARTWLKKTGCMSAKAVEQDMILKKQRN